MTYLSNWIEGSDAIVTADDVPYLNWSDWGASQRDLYLVDYNQNIVFHQNISNGIPSSVFSDLINLISEIPNEECEDGVHSSGDQEANLPDGHETSRGY